MSPSFQRDVPYQIFRCTASLELKVSRATPFTFRREMKRTTGRVTSTRASRASDRVPSEVVARTTAVTGPSDARAPLCVRPSQEAA